MRVIGMLVVSLGLGAVVVASHPSRSTPSGATDPVLRQAILQKDVRAVEARLAAGGDPRAREVVGGRTLLMDAVATGNPEIVRALLRDGAEPSASTERGWTALHEAVMLRQAEALRQILDAGGAVDALDRLEGTPLDLAEREGFVEEARMLRARGARGSGKSVGDTVCVLPWSGEGYCGVVLGRAVSTYRLRVSKVVGCEGGCKGISPCSGDAGFEALAVAVDVEVPASCLTHTGLRPDGEGR